MFDYTIGRLQWLIDDLKSRMEKNEKKGEPLNLISRLDILYRKHIKELEIVIEKLKKEE